MAIQKKSTVRSLKSLRKNKSPRESGDPELQNRMCLIFLAHDQIGDVKNFARLCVSKINTVAVHAEITGKAQSCKCFSCVNVSQQ